MLAGALFLSGSLAALAAPAPRARLYVERDAVVRVTDARLAEAGFRVEDAAVDRLRLRLQGEDVPVLLRRLEPGSADGRFEILFPGRFARGEHTWQSEYGPANVYVLDVAPRPQHPPRLRLEPAVGGYGGARRFASPATRHFESNTRLVRFGGDEPPPESWFWAELKAIDPEPLRLPVSVDAVAPAPTFTLRVHFVGLSSLPAEPDHEVRLSWNGQAAGTASWDGEAGFTFQAVLDGALLKEGTNELRLEVPGERTAGVDLLVLDWIEVEHHRAHRIEDGQAAVTAGPTEAAVLPGEDGPLLAFESGRPRVLSLRPGQGLVRAEGPASFEVVRPGEGSPPARIVATRPRGLAAGGADFVIVSHASLLPAAETLAAARRAEGLATEVVPVEDVYDRFGHGFARPRAIQDFLAHAWRAWHPRPRYVLLLGDASWDYQNRLVSDAFYDDWDWQATQGPSLPRNQSTPYRQGLMSNDRQLVPTVQWQSPWGHAASDNAFALFEGDDDRPDLAVGRLPVATLADAQAIVDKTLAAERAARTPAALFVTDDDRGRQMDTEELARAAEGRGYHVDRVYPGEADPDNARSTGRILEAFDGGLSVALFAGHGGRYIWRTGPPDLRKNHDLFGIADLDRLAPTPAVPVVVSLTCYSAPFDHPTADSIGEKLLRLPGKGALAVVAASWRNNPPLSYGGDILQALAGPGPVRVGDAFLAAMRKVDSPIIRNTYNLLGDPTARVGGTAPGATVE